MSNDSNSGSSAIQVPAPAGQQPYQTSSPGTAVLQTQGPAWQQPYQAKGLEWSSVFLIWLVDGQFPNSRVIDGEDLDLMEEERRLFYVALTRAKDDLYLIYPMMNPRSYTGDVICRPSRFLGDFPPDMVEEWRIGSGRESGGDDPF